MKNEPASPMDAIRIIAYIMLFSPNVIRSDIFAAVLAVPVTETIHPGMGAILNALASSLMVVGVWQIIKDEKRKRAKKDGS